MRGETGAGQQHQKISADKPFFFRESRPLIAPRIPPDDSTHRGHDKPDPQF